MTDPSLPVQPKPAATIMLLRDAQGLEVLMVQRHHQIEFASGALVFPGGKMHQGDHDPAWEDHLLDGQAFPADQRALRIAAIREVFEEAGVLLARRRDGGLVDAASCSVEVRQAVDAGETPFLDVVRSLDARLDLAALTVFARWITPDVPKVKRFDTWFFVARMPEEQLAASDGRETVDAVWLAPAEALRLREEGSRKVVFPTRMNLKLLSESPSAGEAVARAAARPLVTVQVSMQQGPDGPMLVLPPDAGYGAVRELVSALD